MQHRKNKTVRKLRYALASSQDWRRYQSGMIRDSFKENCTLHEKLKRVEHRADNAARALHDALHSPLDAVRKDSVKLAALRFALAACEGELTDRVRSAWEATK